MLAPLVISIAALALAGLALFRIHGLERFTSHQHLEALAKTAVTSAEQMKGAGHDKARIATQHLIDMRPELSPASARRLVEAAVFDLNRGKKQ